MIAYEKKSKSKKAFILSLSFILVVSVGFLTKSLFDKQNADTLVFKDELPVIKLPASKEKIVKPFKVDATLAIDYFDGTSKNTTSIVEFEGVYRPSQGLDFTNNDEEFEVIAALSGVVSDVKSDPLFGNSITIKSDNLEITYQSLKDVKQKVGDEIQQGSTLSLAGKNIYNADLGNHLHLVIEKDEKIVDPNLLINLK